MMVGVTYYVKQPLGLTVTSSREFERRPNWDGFLQ